MESRREDSPSIPFKLVHALALAAVFLAEFALFHLTASRDHAWIFPQWYDQLQYLTEAYQGYEHAQTSGFLAGAKETLTNTSPQGALHDFWALLLFKICGPSRSAALALNLLAFLGLQTATFFTVRKMSGSMVSAWVSIAFLLALHGPWSGGSGSAVDFRLDWMAACAYGVALAAAIAGQGFRSTRGALGFGAAVGLVVLTRYLTAVYFVFIYAALLAAVLCDADRWKRCGRLLLSGFVALGMGGPFLWHSRATIRGYYWTGHIEGPERVLRESHQGSLAAFRWVLSQALLEQTGLVALVLFAGGSAALWSARVIPRPHRIAPPLPLRDAWRVTLIFFAVPVSVLSLHTVQAPQPVSIVLPATVWLAILGWMHFERSARRGMVVITGATIGLTAAALFVTTMIRRPETKSVDDAAKVNALADYFFFRAEECGLDEPSVAVTRLSEGLGAASFQLLGYERHHRWLHFAGPLPTGIFEIAAAEALQRLAESDFVCLVTAAPAATWPSDRQMETLRPQMSAWCETHLRHVGDLEAAGLTMAVYERASFPRPASHVAVNLADLLGRRAPEAHRLNVAPPAAPFFPSPLHQLASTEGEYVHRFAAAYSPLTYRATGLPAGFQLDERTGLLRGRFPRAGAFNATITATNALGATTRELSFEVKAQSRFAAVNLPATSVAGSPVEINYEAFDATGKLDYIDVVDLLTGKAIARLPAKPSERQSWHGILATTFEQAGTRAILFRFVCFDPQEKQPYTFFDEQREITVSAR